MEILYVTTFNEKLYNMTGKDLITSFIKYINNADMLVCYEDFEFKSEYNNIISYDLKNDEYMNTWLNKHKDKIPKFYGGNAEDDSEIFIDKNIDYWAGKKGQSWANYRASRYFRKIVSLNYAITNFSEKYDYIFVIDSDCIFKSAIKHTVINDLFSNSTSMIYFWSKFRESINRGPETGFTGYSKANNGFNFAKIICECFSSGKFLNYTYWDDGYVIGQVINEYKNNKHFILKDLVGDIPSKTTRVMELKNQPLFDYVHHFKNKHKSS